MGNKVWRMEALLNRLKSVHLSLTARQPSRDLGGGGCKVDLHNYTAVIYDDSPDVSPERRKFLARALRISPVFHAYFAKRYQEPSPERGRATLYTYRLIQVLRREVLFTELQDI